MPTARSSTAHNSILSILLALALAMLTGTALANPFGVPLPAAAPAASGEWWQALYALQASFLQKLTLAMRSVGESHAALLTLLGLAFSYGALHAAGPGHGKAIIASYLVANRSSALRGIALSFMAGITQALIAILLVAVLVYAIAGTAQEAQSAASRIEKLSILLIVALGLWLTVQKSRAFIHAWQQHHGHACSSGCSHYIPPQNQPETTLKAMLLASIAAGARPCTGALLLLTFAASQKVFMEGALAVLAMGLGTASAVCVLAVITVYARHFAAKLAKPDSRKANTAFHIVELVASLFILAIGILLFLGVLTSDSQGF